VTTDELLDNARALLEAEHRAGRLDAARIIDALVDRCVGLRHQRDIRAGQLERTQVRLAAAEDELAALRREAAVPDLDIRPRPAA
jgi:hypothetical protein